ncbi:uncharacterized protein [Epargyreus clarus]|uniref:uncharacterized protein isoform X2 n=1 Tax=Epargyreus clarus TaxID=520877 RepID=UPI003C2E1088
MMLTIHGLPSNTTYQDLKRLIKQECNITDFILDNLVMDDDGCKKVRIGVTDDSDGSQLMKCLNGYHLLQHVIRIVPIGKPGQQNHYDARGNYQPRNDYNQGHNFGNRPMGQDVQRVSSWVPNVQWEQPMPAPVQNTFPNQPQPIQNNAFVPQGPRGAFIPARVQGFGYQPKHPIPDRPMAPMKDNFHGPGQFEHQAPVPQVPFQAQPHVQPQPWNPQVPPVKPQQPAPGGYNQMPFNDNRQMPKPGMMNEGYKDYDKGDRRFEPQVRGPSPRRRMSPGPHGRRMSPPGLQGRRMSPPGPQGRRMSPPGPQGRRMSPPGPQGRRMSPPGPQGRRMSPPGPQGRRLSPPGLQGRRMSPSGPQGRRMSPGPHGRRMSPPGPLGRTMSPGPHGRKMSPPGPHGRRISPPGPHGRRMSPPGSHGRRVSPPGPHGRRMSPPGPHARRMSPPGPHGRRMSPPGPHGRRMSPPGPHGRRMSPPGQQGRRMSPGPQGRRSPSDLQGRRISPTAPHGRRMSPGPQARRMSPGPLGPTGRRISPPGPHHGLHGRRLSPTGPSGPPVRRISPGHQGRRMSPSRMGSMQLRAMSPGHGRKMSPSGYGRRVSPNVPHGQRMDPHGVPRRMSPTDRRLQGRQSPGRRGSPRRLSPKRHSPGRRSLSPRHRSPLLEQPGIRGYQPSFHQSKKPKYEDDDRPSHLKQVRPAYEPPTKAPNQAMYSGGYRPNVHDNVQYPLPSTRSDPWQQNTDKPANYPPSKTLDSRIEKFDIPRVSEHLRMGDVEPKRSRSGTRDSRSPVRRDRSPFKDRYRRHSPSPRSPRRSWALEKRRSPLIGEAPPPPVWPGQNRDPEFARQNRPMFSDVPDKMDKKHAPTWERPVYEDKNEALRHDKGPDTFARNNPTHSEKWKPISSSKELPRDNFRQDDRFPENARDSHNYGAKEQFERQGASERMQYTDKRDFRDYPMKKDDRDELRQKKDVPLRRDDFSRGDENRREIFRTNPAELNKEIEDVYKRVAELGKKAQEYRKKESRFEDRGEFFDQNEDTMQRSRDRRDYVPDDRYQGDKEDRSRQTDDVDKPVRQRESRWSNTDKVWRPRPPLSSPAKANRERAAEELARRIMNKFKTDISESQKARVSDELQLTLKRIFYDMFKTEDVSYIELVIRFNKKFDVNDEKKIFEDVMSSFSSNYRKRAAPDQPDIPAKTSKRSPDNIIKEPGAPVRQRRANPAPDKKSYIAPRAPHVSQNINDSTKPKSVDKKPTTQTKVANQNSYRPEQKPGIQQEFKRPLQKNNVKVSVQKTKPSLGGNLVQKSQNTINSQKTEAQKDISSEKTKPESTDAQKNVPQENIQKIKTEDHGSLKTDAKDATSSQNTMKNEKDLKQTENSVKIKQEPKTPESSTEKRQLDPLLERVLEQELQDIMIQMWQELPDDPVEQDRIAVDKLRNEVGDDFRRVLGLNITKRLLNVYNNLYVKVHFSCRPQMGRLTRFLKEYHINKFKRIDKNSNTFAAQIENIEDFDRICSAQEITCGMARVTVAPCYKFTLCPETLKTIYDDPYYYEDSSQESAESTKYNKNKNDLEKTEKINANEENSETMKKVDIKNEKAEINNTTLDAKDSNSIKKDKTPIDNEKTMDSSKTVENKNVSNEEVIKARTVDTAVTENTVNDKNVTNNIKIENEDSKNITKDDETKKIVTKEDVNKNMTEDTENVTKNIDTNKNVTKDTEVSTNVTKVNEVSKNVTEEVENNKNVTKIVETSTHVTNDNHIFDDKLDIDDYEDYLDTEIPENQFDSDEELNDEDILALMSEGVVVDECSGSDDDNSIN